MFKRTICLTCGKVYVVGITGNKWGCKDCALPEQPVPQPKQPKEKVVAVTKANSFGK